jgi:hypothetical protein
MKLKFLAAAAALAILMTGPATAREVYHRGHHYHHYYNRVGPVGAVAGIAGAAIGTAGAIATAPFRGSYAYDHGYDPYYGDRGYDRYYGPGPYYRRGW